MGGACCASSAASTLESFGDVATASDECRVTHASYSVAGKGENQDSPLTFGELGGLNGAHLFAVFDGHGEHGKEISGFVRQQVPISVVADPSFPRKPQIALQNATEVVNTKLRNTMYETASESGSTGCMALIIENEIITANTGDSRAIVGVRNGTKGTRPLQITEEHTVKNPKETPNPDPDPNPINP